MSRLTVFVGALGLLLACQRAEAQSWEASAFAGYTPAVDIDRRAPDLNQLDVRGAFTWGVQAARRFTTHWGTEVLWTQQQSALEGGTASSGTFDFFTMTVRQLQGNVLYRVRRRPGKGATVRVWWPRRNVPECGRSPIRDEAVARARRRRQILSLERDPRRPWTLSIQADDAERRRSAGDFCDPFGFCQGSPQQIEFAIGAIVRF